MKVAVIGLGYVGLPLACLASKKGHDVIGFDINQNVVDKVNQKISHIKDEQLQRAVSEADVHATTDPEDIKDCTVYLIAVPTPINEDREPEFGPLISATKTVIPYINPGDLVVVESTVFPGTIEQIVVPLLEEAGLHPGKDFYLAHCPERVNPGDAFWTTENIPRVVGAMSQEGTEKAARFYQTLLGGDIFDVRDVKQKLRPKIIPEDKGYRINSMPLSSITKMHSIRDAEAVKAMENTVRDVNIAFVNELARISDVLGLDVVDIIDGMSTKPFGKGPYYPGIGVGGHCIAVDPEWLKSASIKAGYIPNLIQKARDINNSMPKYAVSLLKRMDAAKVAVLGVAYKKNIDDPRESPFFDVKRLLLGEEIAFEVFDPWYTEENTVESVDEALEGAEALLLVTDHDAFELTAGYLKEKGVKAVIDGRNFLDGEAMKAAGIEYKGIGR